MIQMHITGIYFLENKVDNRLSKVTPQSILPTLKSGFQTKFG